MSTPEKRQIARGNTATQDAYTGPQGELRMDTDRNDLRIHDGVTPGGARIPNINSITDLVNTIVQGGVVATVFVADTTALANLAVSTTTLAVTQVDGLNAFYVWKPGVAPAPTLTNSAYITSNITGYWAALGSDAKADQIKEAPFTTGPKTYTLGNLFRTGWYWADTSFLFTGNPNPAYLTNFNSMAVIDYRHIDGNSAVMLCYGVKIGVVGVAIKTAGVWSAFSWIGIDTVTYTNLNTVALRTPGFYKYGASASNAPNTSSGWVINLVDPTTPSGTNYLQIALDSTGGAFIRTNFLAWSPMSTITYGAVGTYIFALNGGATTAPGATIAGSSLTPANDSGATAGSVLTGTWQAMGAGTTARATLWLRIS